MACKQNNLFELSVDRCIDKNLNLFLRIAMKHFDVKYCQQFGYLAVFEKAYIFCS